MFTGKSVRIGDDSGAMRPVVQIGPMVCGQVAPGVVCR
jgi:hypothetical protein